MTTKSILIVDDDSAIRKYLSYTLNSANYQVELATDGYEALTQARNSKYDLAIVDLVLPGEMNGMDIINSLKTISPDTRVIATSAYSGQAFGDKTTRAGADIFITKTLLAEKLLTSVESLLEKPAISTEEFIIPTDSPIEPELRPEEMILSEGPPANQEIRAKNSKASENPSLHSEDKMEELTPDQIIIPSGKPEKSDNKSFTPHILKKLPRDIIADILTLGRLIKVEAGKQVIVNYTGEVVIVNAGRAKCKYRNKIILTLNEGDAVGEECLLLDYDPQFRIIIEAEQALQLIIIPKDVLNDYFKKHDVSIFIGFQLNVNLSLSKKLRQSFTQLDRI
ncbi:MAG: response regulator [Calditrichaeota bacterium]|nr:response regulator [Calditrichota bacterium]